jgi:XTP/dITP diphosphohydrolase
MSAAGDLADGGVSRKQFKGSLVTDTTASRQPVESEGAAPVLIATKNPHKAGELAALIVGLSGALALADWEARNGRVLPGPAETGRTLAANALLKARAYAAATGLVTLADDSGLTVPALGGAPGVHSARFGGVRLTDGERCLLLLRVMRARRDRRAFFTTVLALGRPDGRHLLWRGRLDGRLTRVPAGRGGFGYDPVFQPQGSARTLAQMSPGHKNAISHRARAARAFLADESLVRTFLGQGSALAQIT